MNRAKKLTVLFSGFLAATNAFIKRVIADGGQVFNKNLINNLFRNIKTATRLYSATAVKISETAGRKVVDTWYDLFGTDATFTGDNRPEFTNIAGVQSVCVEKGTTNLLSSNPASLVFEGGWSTSGGAVATITQNEIIEGVTDKATRVQISGGTTVLKYICNIDGVEGGPEYTGAGSTSIWVKNIGVHPVRAGTARFGNVSSSPNVQIKPNQTVFVVEKNNTSVEGTKRLEIRTTDASHSVDIIAFQPQAEASSYPTLFTQGTRLAPAPVLNDFILGTEDSNSFSIIMWVDFIHASTIGSRDFIRSVVNGDDLIWFLRTSTGLPYEIRYKGSGTALSSNIIGSEEFKRYKAFYALTFVEGEQIVYEGDIHGNLWKIHELNIAGTIPAQNAWLSSNLNHSSMYFKAYGNADKKLTQQEVIDLYTKTGKAIFSDFEFESFTDQT